MSDKTSLTFDGANLLQLMEFTQAKSVKIQGGQAVLRFAAKKIIRLDKGAKITKENDTLYFS